MDLIFGGTCMLQLDELRLELEGLEPELQSLGQALNLTALREEAAALEQESAKPGFWDDMAAGQKILQKIRHNQNICERYDKLHSEYNDLFTMIEIANEENDESLVEDITASAEKVKAELESQKLTTLLSGEYDSKNAILTFHAGAGGTEAQDWAQMLYRMYHKWADRHAFKVKLLDYLDGDEAGLKSASILIEGENAYGFLRSEAGVHRLVRVSPFDSSGRRHTSFASLEVMPEIDDEEEIPIRDEDLRVDTYRSSGAGGQHVNKTESAIRITHLPTGIVVACQTERSQIQNRATAMKMLKSRLAEIKQREHLEKIEDIKGEQKEIGWGSQIRSYVFMPYTLAKDHRTGFESGNIGAVMDGDLDGFINAYLVDQAKQNAE
jgi:peptide chain release factor 2